HVVKGCSLVRVRVGGVLHDGIVAFTDDRNDLALVRTHVTDVEPLRFREGKKGIRPADGVVALGYPYSGLLATSPQVTTGAVSALAGVHDDTRVLQLTAPIQPGNSGGPLLDLTGKECDHPRVSKCAPGRLFEWSIWDEARSSRCWRDGDEIH